MFSGKSLTELTQLEQPTNTSNYSPIHARLTQEAYEDEIDAHQIPWRIKPMIITKERLAEFSVRISRQGYNFGRMHGFRGHGMNPMLYWMIHFQRITHVTFNNPEVDFYVNDLYMSLNAEGRRRIPIQCSEGEWDDKFIEVGIERRDVQIRYDTDDDTDGPHSEEDEEDDIAVDANEAKGFTRFYWCHPPQEDEVE
jgi:hypothetical protein